MKLVLKSSSFTQREKEALDEFIRFGSEHNWMRKAKIKGHYRHLPNGKIVFIREHRDKRKDAKKNPEKFKGKVVHSDDKTTTYVNHKGELQQMKHEPYQEMSQEDIHGHLNSAMTIDDELGKKMWMHSKGIKDMDKFLSDLIADEKSKADRTGAEPEFTNKKDAMEWLLSAKQDKKGQGFKGIKQHTKELQDKYGHVTTYAGAYNHDTHDDFRKFIDDTATDEGEHIPDADRAEAQMIMEHSAGAKKAEEAEQKAVAEAKKRKPEDCPVIHGLSKDTGLFGHQAETLAKLDVLPKAIIDVDMGGGKGLILPADALNLMGQGKVKRPLVVVPGATLHQNASKIHEYTDRGVNVFLISNDVIKEQFDGNMEKLNEEIRKAPPNTIFMASYDVFSYVPPEDKGEDEYARSRALGAAGFDYVALDESHNIKNVQTRRFKSMKYLTRAKYKRVASGTFLSNNPLDVLGQISFLNPGKSITEEEFKKKYGYEETDAGVHWRGLKQLRADLSDMGMISLRRSAWIDKLPERKENLSVVKMESRQSAVYKAVLEDVVDQLEQEIAKNPRLKKFFDDDGLGEMDDLPPQALAKLNLIGGIVDHPHEMAEMMEQKLEQVKEAKESGEVDADTQELIESLMKMKGETRKAIRSLRGIVSPKAQDVYKRIGEHFKDKKNGKYIVFCQRKASASHIMDNMPEEFKKHAVYYDASKKRELDAFVKDPKGPKIIVAVDASIKEGVNMQIANGMYRYDHHWSPGNQEQSYARIWRFGQDKPAQFHLGIMDGTLDVPKYARLITKLHQNMQVTSDFEDSTVPAFKMNLRTIQEESDASILGQYSELNKNILDYQKEENKTLAKRFGKGMLKRSSGKPIGGNKAEQRHGLGPYHEDADVAKFQKLSDNEADSMLGHFRDEIKKLAGGDAVFDQDLYDSYLMDLYNLIAHNKARGQKKFDPHSLKQFEQEFERVQGEPMTEKEKKLYTNVATKVLSGAKHTPHDKHGLEEPVKLVAQRLKLPVKDKAAVKIAMQEAQKLAKILPEDAITHIGGSGEKGNHGLYDIEDQKAVDAAIAKMEKQAGEKFSDKYKKFLLGVVAMHHETAGGWKKIAYQYEDKLGHFGGDEEEP